MVEKGRYSEAETLLLPLTQEANEIIDRLISACFLAKSEYFMGNIDESLKWLKFAEDIDKNNPIVERISLIVNPKLAEVLLKRTIKNENNI